MTKDDKQAFEVPDRLFEYVRAVVDNRALATVLLFLLSLLLIGIGNIAGILAVLLIGFLLIDRFEIVRRCVVIGGAAWAMTLAIGAMALGGIEGPVLFDAGFVFNMLGFVLALAVCVLFFCGRALYYQGYEQGERHSDRVLAARIQDRLIDHPDAWDNIDGDFLEVEGALNRVRDRERKVQQALRDESHRKDDLVTYLAHDLRTPLTSRCCRRHPTCRLSSAHTLRAWRSTRRTDSTRLLRSSLISRALTSTILCLRAATSTWDCYWRRWPMSSIPFSTSSTKMSKLMCARI